MKIIHFLKRILKAFLPAPAESFHKRTDCIEHILSSLDSRLDFMDHTLSDISKHLESYENLIIGVHERINNLYEIIQTNHEILVFLSSREKDDYETIQRLTDLFGESQSKIESMLEDGQLKLRLLSDTLLDNHDILLRLSNSSEHNQEMVAEVHSLIDRSRLELEKRAFEYIPNTNIEKQAWELAGIQTAEYVIANLPKCEVYNNPDELRDMAVDVSAENGLFLEFGVYSGKTINRAAERKPDCIFYGFDSFCGLPETWRTGFQEGTFARQDLPEVRENVKLVVGLFHESLPGFLENHEGNCAYIHIDCDLYSSTKAVFDALNQRIVPGTVIVFDEFFNYPSWQQNEFRAFQEFVTQCSVQYEYIGYVPGYEQAAVRIVDRS